MKKIAIFGSTGSIGESTLQVIRENPNLFKVVTLVAGQNIQKLEEQIKEFNPKNVYITAKENANRLQEKYPHLNVFYGEEGLEQIAKLIDFDVSVSALVGIAGLRSYLSYDKKWKNSSISE